jgi:hypothetical protein
MIRSDVEKTFAGKLDDSQLALAALRIASTFENEIDEARRGEMDRSAARHQ